MPLRRIEEHGLAVALATLAALVLIDIAYSADVVLIASFAVGPLVAATLTTPRRTAAVAGAAVAAAALARLWDTHLDTSDWAVRSVICAAISGFAIVMAVGRNRREERLRRMTVIAETAQRAVLRAMPTAVGAVGFAARYVSASSEALVGGDLYEVAATPYGVRVIVGDVRGKGLEAVQLAASVLGAFRQSAFTVPSLSGVAQDLDRLVAQVSGEEDFVTAVLAEFRDDRTVAIVNCGHHPPLLAHQSEPPQLVEAETTVPLGMGSAPTETEHRWRRGSRLLFYTDGLVEARDRKGAFFSLSGCDQVVLAGNLEDALDALVARLLAHTRHELEDDMALVLAEQRAP